ncbi:conserved membrane hypothetical protein [Vibrio chagasii]|nr:conserved membrane hypothetical protein [Vibrio chagasii]CAH7167545.1 conserved membrane hypothetical protein [Vibrio chagasii]CAH7358635.1 conserved membrane hypothetical protein [Vibrio chagasii]
MLFRISSAIITIIFCGFFSYYNFDLINFDKNLNLDIHNYIANYYSRNWTYDFGFEYYQHIIRDIFNATFDEFWVIILSNIVVFFIINCSSLWQVPFFITNYVFLAYAMGTQVRYFLAVLFFVFAFNHLKGKLRLALILVSSVFHYGVGLLVLIGLVSLNYKDKIREFIENEKLVYLSIAIIYFSSTFLVEAVLPYTRFAYYLNSHYMEAKSVTSFLYVLVSFVILMKFVKVYKKDDDIIYFSLVIQYAILCTSAIAVLSGRLLLVYVIFEVVLALVVAKNNTKFYLAFLVVSSLKVMPNIYYFLSRLV